MGKTQTYKEALQTAVENLEVASGHALAGVLCIAFAREYRELGRLYEEGERLKIDPGMFVDTGDTNIDLILKVVNDIDALRATLININDLEDSSPRREK
jgi:hypothetical protein